MNFGSALSFVFKDNDWFKKVIVGGLFSFLGWFTGILFFLEFFPMGYSLEVLRRRAANIEPTLPEWTDLGKRFVDGLLVAVIYLFYTIIFGGIGTLWIVYVSTGNSFKEATMVIFIVLGALFILFGILYFGTAGITLFAIKGNFIEAFNFPKAIQFIQADVLSLTVILLFSFFLQIAALLAGLAIFSPFTVFWAKLVFFHLIGQYADKFQHSWKQAEIEERGA